MRYLIMECALSYAVALDEEGRFLRVPNLGYEVGQVVEDVVLFGEGEVLEFEARSARRTRGRVGLIAAAACLVVAVVAGGVLWRLPIGTVYMRINPEVSMEVNRLDRVVSLEGENNDGASLSPASPITVGRSMRSRTTWRSSPRTRVISTMAGPSR